MVSMILRIDATDVRVSLGDPLADLHLHRQCRNLGPDQQARIQAAIKDFIQVVDEACFLPATGHEKDTFSLK